MMRLRDAESLSELLRSLDLCLESAPERDGLRVYRTQARVPFVGLPLEALAESAPADVERASDDERLSDDSPFVALLQARASSTGVDSHGTEMTAGCLRDMAEQMKAGTIYVPTHWDTEWDEIIGRTVDAEIESARIAEDGATGKPGKGEALRVVIGLYDEDRAHRLVRAVKRGDSPIGTSIGGWFRDMEFLFNDDDELERVLIHKIELDHLATTRRPSNRESWIDGLIERARSLVCKPPTVRDENADTGTNSESVSTLKDADTGDDSPSHSESAETPTVSTPAATALDSVPNPGSTVSEQDASQRAKPSPTNDDTTDHAMSDGTENTQSAELTGIADAQRATNEKLDTLIGLMSAQAERTAPTTPAAPAAESGDEARALKLQNAELRARLQRTMTAASRAGVGAITRQRVELAGGYAGMVKRCAAQLGDDSAIAMVANAQAERRDASISKTPSRDELEQDLRSLLAAAYADGVIADPHESAAY